MEFLIWQEFRSVLIRCPASEGLQDKSGGGVGHILGPGHIGEPLPPDTVPMFVKGRDQLEEQVRGVLVERDVAYFVND